MTPSSDTDRSVPIEKVCAASGLTKRQVMSLTRQRRIPASIIGRTFSMTSGQFEQFKREGIAPVPEPQSKPTFLQTFDQKRSA